MNKSKRRTRPSLPPENGAGYIPTKNRNGGMNTEITGCAKEFVEFAAKSKGWSLDIGCAYGIHAIAAINLGACVVANDIDPRHVKLVAPQIPPHLQLNLRTRAGGFPNISLPNGAFSAVLAANSLCFLDAKTMDRAIAKIFRLLAPGGKAFVRMPTPYIWHADGILPEYKRRKAANERWPGCFEDMDKYRDAAAKSMFKGLHHFTEPDVLSRAFAEAGFVVEFADYQDPNSASVAAAGGRSKKNKEFMALIACKP